MILTKTLIQSVVLCALALLLARCVDEQPSGPKATTGSIFGTVLDAASTLPISQALVTSVPPTSSVVSDSVGRYRINLVPEGSYVVQASKPGVGSGTTTINVSVGKETQADLFITHDETFLGTIAGTVTGENGERVGGASVSTLPATQSTTTDASGYYVIADVDTGEYEVSAQKTGIGSGLTNVVVHSDVVVQADIVLLRLDPTKGRIIGNVVDVDVNKPAAGAIVRLIQADVLDTTDATGEFVFNNVLPGVKHLEISYSTYDRKVKEVMIIAGEESTITINFTTKLNTPLITNGLLAYYPMAGSADDASENSFDGVLEGSPTFAFDRKGNASECILFDGKYQRIRVRHAVEFNTLPLSLAFWIRFKGEPNDDGLFVGKFFQSGGEGYSFFSDGGELCASYTRNKFTDYARTCSEMPSFNRWTHVAIVFTTGLTRLYIDGLLLNSSAWAGDAAETTTVQDFLMGQLESTIQPPGILQGLNGWLDDVYVFTRELAPPEINALAE